MTKVFEKMTITTVDKLEGLATEEIKNMMQQASDMGASDVIIKGIEVICVEFFNRLMRRMYEMHQQDVTVNTVTMPTSTQLND